MLANQETCYLFNDSHAIFTSRKRVFIFHVFTDAQYIKDVHSRTMVPKGESRNSA